MVTLNEICSALDASVLTELHDPKLELKAGCGADLMSDVLSFSHMEDTLLFSGLTNQQVVRTAEVAGIPVIAFVRGKMPPPETIALAEDRGIALLSTRCSLFEACGRLYRMGLESVDVRGEDRKKIDAELAELTRKNKF